MPRVNGIMIGISRRSEERRNKAWRRMQEEIHNMHCLQPKKTILSLHQQRQESLREWKWNYCEILREVSTCCYVAAWASEVATSQREIMNSVELLPAVVDGVSMLWKTMSMTSHSLACIFRWWFPFMILFMIPFMKKKITSFHYFHALFLNVRRVSSNRPRIQLIRYPFQGRQQSNN